MGKNKEQFTHRNKKALSLAQSGYNIPPNCRGANPVNRTIDGEETIRCLTLCTMSCEIRKEVSVRSS